MYLYNLIILVNIFTCLSAEKWNYCLDAHVCMHKGNRKCGLNSIDREVRWFLNTCDIWEFNCEYKKVILIVCAMATLAHGPPRDRDSEDIVMGRKMGAKWCSMAKVCNHDRVPICGVSHAGEVMGFRDLCDMFDFNCIRRRNYKQTTCPEDKSILTVSRRPPSNYYDN